MRMCPTSTHVRAAAFRRALATGRLAPAAGLVLGYVGTGIGYDLAPDANGDRPGPEPMASTRDWLALSLR
jgi:hypothetical protein